MSNTYKVPFGQKIAFGFGMLANQMFPAIISIFIVVLVQSLGFPGWMWGVVSLVPRLFDAITDPIMGFISDNTKSRWGRRRQYVFLGAIIMGSNLQQEKFSWLIFSLAASTAILLQILSNLANDYGDFKKGTDKHRSDRQLAGGNITPRSMMIAIVIFAFLALVTGVYHLTFSF